LQAIIEVVLGGFLRGFQEKKKFSKNILIPREMGFKVGFDRRIENSMGLVLFLDDIGWDLNNKKF